MKYRSLQIAIFSLSLSLVLSACGGGNSAPPTSTISPPAPTAEPSNTLEATRIPSASTPIAAGESTPEPTTGTAQQLGALPFAIPTRGAGAIHDADSDGLLTWDEYQLAIRDMINAFPWPSIFDITLEHIISLWPEESRTARFQVGFERDNVGSFWECAWLISWLESRNGVNPELEAQAEEYIVNSMPNMTEDESSQILLRERADQVLLGDPTSVINSVNANCSTLNFESSETTDPETSFVLGNH